MKRCLLLFLLILLSSSLVVEHGWTASKLYVNPESPITIGDSGTIVLTMNNLGTNAGRLSTRYDRGAGAHAAFYEWRCTIALTGTNIVGAAVEWYVATSDGTTIDGTLSATDAALTTDKRNNLKLVGLTIVDQTTTNTAMTASGWIYIPSRYLSWGVWNGTTINFQASGSANSCSLTPQPIEAQ